MQVQGAGVQRVKHPALAVWYLQHACAVEQDPQCHLKHLCCAETKTWCTCETVWTTDVARCCS